MRFILISKNFQRLFIALMVMGTVVDTCAKVQSEDCLGSLRQSLYSGAFSGPMDCNSAVIKLKRIGTIKTFDAAYSIYDFRYRTVPVSNLVAHGGQKILIFRSGDFYLGQYALSPPPLRRIRVLKKSVVIDVPEEQGNKIAIGSQGPPNSVRLDETIVHFAK